MGHQHHHHTHSATVVNRAFIIGIILNMGFVIIEAAVGFYTDSLALLSDAGHNLSDVASLALSLLAFKLAKVKSTPRYSYGYRKSTILASLFNAIILLFAVGGIIYEAIIRLNTPQPIAGKTVAIVAFIGILINSITAYLFMSNKDQDLNVKSAYLHLVADALVSLGVVLAGILVMFTHWYWVDGVVSIIIAIVVLVSTWQLLKSSFRLAMDGIPDDIEIEKIQTTIKNIDGVADFRHIHIWALSTTENALTGHLVVKNYFSDEALQALKNQVKHELEHFNIQHSTIEIETPPYHSDDHCSASK